MKLFNRFNQKKLLRNFPLVLMVTLDIVAVIYIISSTFFHRQLISLLYPKPYSYANLPQFTKNVGVDAKFYSDPSISPYILAGDMVREPAVRNATETAMLTTDSKFINSIKYLESVNLPGVKKMLDFSAVSDAQQDISSVPQDVTYIDYDLEGSLSPASDLANIPLSVTQFATIVHNAGKIMMFSPTDAIFNQLIKNNTLATALTNVDAVQYQGQKPLQAVEPCPCPAFESQINDMYNKIEAAHPGIEFDLQLWLNDNTFSDVVTEFENLQSIIGIALIGTHSSSQIPNISLVLQALKSPAPTPTAGVALTNTPIPTAISTPTPTNTVTPTPTLTNTPTPIPLLTVSGMVYVDSNRNGVEDSGEIGSVGTTVTISGAGSATTVTNSSGTYSFNNLASNMSYTVTMTTPTGYMATTASAISLPQITANTTVNFGIAPIPTATPTPIGIQKTITLQVSSSSDDVNQDGTTLTTNGTDWVGNGQSTSSSYTGLRFINAAIPKNATIISASLSLYSVQSQWINVLFNTYADAIGNSQTFSTANKPSQRSLTVHFVSHYDNSKWKPNTWYTLEDISPVIQEVVNRTDWQSGNALSLILKGTGASWGRKSVQSFDGSSSFAEKLTVTYK